MVLKTITTRAAPWLLAALAWGAGAVAAPLKIYGMESPPICFRDGEQVDGLVVDLAHEIQRRIGNSDPIEIVPWARANTMATMEPNVLLLTIVRTPERARYLSFVGPVFQTELKGYVLRSRLEELKARDPEWRHARAGARRGSVFVTRARERGYDVREELTGLDIAVRMLLARRFDLWFEGQEIVDGALRQAGHTPVDVVPVVSLGTDEVYFAFSQGTPEEVVQAWDSAMHAIKRDGTFVKIHRRWIPHEPLPSDVRPAR